MVVAILKSDAGSTEEALEDFAGLDAKDLGVVISGANGQGVQMNIDRRNSESKMGFRVYRYSVKRVRIEIGI